MIYLSGALDSRLLADPDLGWMITPNIGTKVDLHGARWAADTGCFSAASTFQADRYFKWLQARLQYAPGCLFATAEDCVGDAERTILLSEPMLPELRGCGFRAVLVAQDGLEDLPVPWDDFDALFIGGTTRWKLSEAAFALAAEAKQRGKWTHMGRVNSWRRFKAAVAGGFDSVDGTFLKFGPDKNLPRLLSWVSRAREQGMMKLIAGARE